MPNADFKPVGALDAGASMPRVASANAARVRMRFICASLSDTKTGENPVEGLFGSDAVTYMPERRESRLQLPGDEVHRFAAGQRCSRAFEASDRFVDGIELA